MSELTPQPAAIEPKRIAVEDVVFSPEFYRNAREYAFGNTTRIREPGERKLSDDQESVVVKAGDAIVNTGPEERTLIPGFDRRFRSDGLRGFWFEEGHIHRVTEPMILVRDFEGTETQVDSGVIFKPGVDLPLVITYSLEDFNKNFNRRLLGGGLVPLTLSPAAQLVAITREGGDINHMRDAGALASSSARSSLAAGFTSAGDRASKTFDEQAARAAKAADEFVGAASVELKAAGKQVLAKVDERAPALGKLGRDAVRGFRNFFNKGGPGGTGTA